MALALRLKIEIKSLRERKRRQLYLDFKLKHGSRYPQRPKETPNVVQYSIETMVFMIEEIDIDEKLENQDTPSDDDELNKFFEMMNIN